MERDVLLPLGGLPEQELVSARDCYVYDSTGKQYFDFESGVWVANVGHCHARITRVIERQIAHAIHHGYAFRNSASEELSAKLLGRLHVPQGKSVFLSSGSEAINLAITLSRNLTKRKNILKIENAFLSSYGHGMISPENTQLLTIQAEDFDAIPTYDYGTIAAFVFEPGTAWGRINFPSQAFITTLVEEIRRHDCLLIVDEVTTGMGRTGRWFGFQHYDVSPDIVVIGKGLGNGYPVSAVSVNQRVADLFDQEPFRYAQSHQNDPLGCAIGVEVMRILDEEGLIAQSRETGAYFKECLLQMQTAHREQIKEIRARGMMLAMELVSDVDVEQLRHQLFTEGFVVGQKEQVLRFMPPLTIKKDAIDALIQTLGALIS
jgi:acetylornithine aminotransferase